MRSVYAVLGPQDGVTTTGAHQVGIDFSGHLGLVREIDGRAGRHDAPPGAVYVTGRSPITWLEVSEKDNGYNRPEESLHNWVMANQRMAAALKAKQYHYQFLLARESGHVDGRVVRQTLPQALEWVWRGYRTR